MKAKLDNVSVSTGSGGLGKGLSWEVDGGIRFHVWERQPGTLYKNPPHGVERHDTNHFETRKLDATKKDNAAMIAEAKRIAAEQNLYEKAEEAERQKKAAEQAEREAAIVLKNKRDAAEALYDALKAVEIYIAPTSRPAPDALYKQVEDAIAKADGKE